MYVCVWCFCREQFQRLEFPIAPNLFYDTPVHGRINFGSPEPKPLTQSQILPSYNSQESPAMTALLGQGSDHLNAGFQRPQTASHVSTLLSRTAPTANMSHPQDIFREQNMMNYTDRQSRFVC